MLYFSIKRGIYVSSLVFVFSLLSTSSVKCAGLDFFKRVPQVSNQVNVRDSSSLQVLLDDREAEIGELRADNLKLTVTSASLVSLIILYCVYRIKQAIKSIIRCMILITVVAALAGGGSLAVAANAGMLSQGGYQGI